MREILEYQIEEIMPDRETILANQGIPRDVEPDDRIVQLADEAVALFEEFCEPSGVIADISVSEFDSVHYGEGQNDKNDPVSRIYPRADFLALFVITVGEEITETISELFEDNDYALASMLDAAASEATEKAGIITEENFMHRLIGENVLFKEMAVLRYSPGYCGWNISGQKKLFEFLEPEEIGITLTESYLMQPLKSISGVMIVGSPEIHQFEMSFPFCDNCLTQDCRDRMHSILKNDF